MSIPTPESITVNDALRALAEYRSVAGIRPPPVPADVPAAGLQHDVTAPPVPRLDAVQPMLPRVGRYVNVLA